MIEIQMIPALTILLIVIVVTLIGVFSIKRIPEGQVYTVRRLGKPAGTLSAGTHLLVPLIDHVAHKICVTGHSLAVEEHLGSGAAATQTLHGRVWWQVLDPERADAMIDRAEDLIRRSLHAALEGDADIVTEQDLRTHNLGIKCSLNDDLRQRGVLVTRVELHLAV